MPLPVLLKYKGTLQAAAVLLICSFLLLLPALYNGYPLVTPDSGSYINTGWLLRVPVDRPITYGIFIRITSLSGLSLWGVVWAQAFILVYYLRRVCCKLLKAYYSHPIFCFIVLVLSACTSVGWTCSQLMPDVFTPILILAITDFYLSPSGSRRSKVLSFFIIWFFMEQHNSNLLIVLLFCVLARLYYVFSKNKWFLKKTLFLAGVTLFSFVSISFFNLWQGNSFRPSAGTHVFIMARMAENGILDQYLQEYCPTRHYELCNYQGQTGDRQWYFMWTDKNLPHVAGWDKAEKEYDSIILGTLTTPKYLFLHIYESLEASVRQCAQVSVAFMVQGAGSPPYNVIQDRFPREIKEYRTALQQLDELHYYTSFFNAVSFTFIIITAAATLLLYTKDTATAFTPNWLFFTAVAITGILANAIVTATFSTVMDRLQSRVSWLLPFAATLYLVYRFREWKNSKAH